MSKFHGGMRKMKSYVNEEGYPEIEMYLLGHRKYMRVHRLVALAFLGEPPAGKPEVRHLDGNPEHNHRSNLAFGTHQENMSDRTRHGRDPKGSRNGRAKIGEDDAAEIRKLLAIGISQSIIGKTYGLESTTVRDIGSGKLWPDVQPANDVRHARLVVVREHASRTGSGISRKRFASMVAAVDKLVAGNGGTQ